MYLYITVIFGTVSHMERNECCILLRKDWKCDAHSRLLGVTALATGIGAVDKTYRKIQRSDEIIFIVYEDRRR